jgi:hypothetical protein
MKRFFIIITILLNGSLGLASDLQKCRLARTWFTKQDVFILSGSIASKKSSEKRASKSDCIKICDDLIRDLKPSNKSEKKVEFVCRHGKDNIGKIKTRTFN